MKKQELIHLHGLLSEVQQQYEEWTDERVNNEDYLKMGIRPTSIHKSKTDHKAAVFTLAKGITQDMENPGSVEISTEKMYEIVLDETAERYTGQFTEVEGDFFSLGLSQYIFDQKHAERLDSSDFPVEYQEEEYGQGKFTIPVSEIEDYLEEQKQSSSL